MHPRVLAYVVTLDGVSKYKQKMEMTEDNIDPNVVVGIIVDILQVILITRYVRTTVIKYNSCFYWFGRCRRRVNTAQVIRP